MRVLAIDVGSSSVKGAFWDGKRFGKRVRVGYETQFDGLRAELDADTVMKAVMRAGREARAEKAEAVAFCALSSGVVVTDDAGKVRFGVVTHQDRRSAVEARDLTTRFSKTWLLQHTGNLPYPGGIGSSTLAWVARHDRGVLRGKCRVGQLSSLIGFHLTGEWAIDPSQAVFLGLWDIRANGWNERLCKAVKVQTASLPRCVWADAVMGGLSANVARSWGIAPGTPVLGGFVDTSAAVMQTRMAAGQLTHNSGSTDVLALCVKEPQPREGVLSRPAGVRGRSGKGVWLAVRTIAAAGSALAWARRELFSDVTDRAWTAILKKADAATGTEMPLTCIPTFSGDRAAIEQIAGATFTGVGLATSREDLLAAIVRGLVKESARNYALLAQLHRPAREVFAMGSASDLALHMHRAWSGKHTFTQLEGDSMAGLVTLAGKTLGS